MPTLIDRDGPIEDGWRWFQADAEAAGGLACRANARMILSLAQWPQHAGELAAAGARLGICLEPADEPAAIVAFMNRIELVAVRFPTFTDGRGYSTARLLRERHGWKGELRAVGDVLRDQMFYLARCGFDTFDLKDGEPVADALAGIRDFTEAYQGAVDRGPLFRRRPSTPAVAGAMAATAASADPAGRPASGIPQGQP